MGGGRGSNGSGQPAARPDPLLRRSVCAAGQPARIQVSRCVRLSESDSDFPALTGRSGTQRARRPLRPELAAPLGVWPSSQLTRCAGDRAGWRLSGDVLYVAAVLRLTHRQRHPPQCPRADRLLSVGHHDAYARLPWNLPRDRPHLSGDGPVP